MEIINVINKGIGIDICIKMLSVALLFVAAFSDIRTKRISLFFPIIQIILSACYWLYQMQFGKIETENFLISFVPGGILLFVCLVSMQGIGIGDGLLVLSLGPLLGMINTLLAILIAFTLSAIVGAVLLIFHRANGKSKIAFVPFLAAGVGVMCFAV